VAAPLSIPGDRAQYPPLYVAIFSGFGNILSQAVTSFFSFPVLFFPQASLCKGPETRPQDPPFCGVVIQTDRVPFFTAGPVTRKARSRDLFSLFYHLQVCYTDAKCVRERIKKKLKQLF
jgi:hypothetical protein